MMFFNTVSLIARKCISSIRVSWRNGTWPATGISLFRIVQPRVDGTASRRSENPSILAPPPVDSSTDLTLHKFSRSQQPLRCQKHACSKPRPNLRSGPRISTLSATHHTGNPESVSGRSQYIPPKVQPTSG